MSVLTLRPNFAGKKQKKAKKRDTNLLRLAQVDLKSTKSGSHNGTSKSKARTLLLL